jgi:hypothetical protein
MKSMLFAALACAVLLRRPDELGQSGEPQPSQDHENAVRVAQLGEQWRSYITEVLTNVDRMTGEAYAEVKNEWHDRVAPGLPHFDLPSTCVHETDTDTVAIVGAPPIPAYVNESGAVDESAVPIAPDDGLQAPAGEGETATGEGTPSTYGDPASGDAATQQDGGE